jgi:hypothetical protein
MATRCADQRSDRAHFFIRLPMIEANVEAEAVARRVEGASKTHQ